MSHDHIHYYYSYQSYPYLYKIHSVKYTSIGYIHIMNKCILNFIKGKDEKCSTSKEN